MTRDEAIEELKLIVKYGVDDRDGDDDDDLSAYTVARAVEKLAEAMLVIATTPAAPS